MSKAGVIDDFESINEKQIYLAIEKWLSTILPVILISFEYCKAWL
jgi:hypothetical protein